MPLAAHARFVSGFLEADETEQKLLTPYPTAGSDYALGWGVSAPVQHGRLFAHNGSNTMWLSSVYLLPDAGLVVIVNTNSFSDEGVAAVNKLARELADAFAE